MPEEQEDLNQSAHTLVTDAYKMKKVYKGRGVSELSKRGKTRGRHRKDGTYCPICDHNPCGKIKR